MDAFCIKKIFQVAHSPQMCRSPELWFLNVKAVITEEKGLELGIMHKLHLILSVLLP